MPQRRQELFVPLGLFYTLSTESSEAPFDLVSATPRPIVCLQILYSQASLNHTRGLCYILFSESSETLCALAPPMSSVGLYAVWKNKNLHLSLELEVKNIYFLKSNEAPGEPCLGFNVNPSRTVQLAQGQTIEGAVGRFFKFDVKKHIY